MEVVGGLIFCGGFVCLFVFIEKENLFAFQKSEIPNIETVPCLFKNLEEKIKKQMGVTTTLNCRTLVRDCMSIIRRWYQVTDGNSDDRYKKTLIYIVLLIFLQNIDWDNVVKKGIA